MAGVMLMTGCDEEKVKYFKKVGQTAYEAYKEIKPEVKDAYLNYKDGNITRDELKDIAENFGQAYLIKRIGGDFNESKI